MAGFWLYTQKCIPLPAAVRGRPCNDPSIHIGWLSPGGEERPNHKLIIPCRRASATGRAAISADVTTLTITGKGRKRRSIPLNKTAREILPRIKPARPNALLLQCYRIATKAEIPQFGPHAMRHWFATQLLIRGVQIAFVSKLLGHASIRTTERAYSHILPSDLANATDVLDDL